MPLHPFHTTINIPSKEEWKDIDGYKGYYQVSSYGRVKTLDRKIVVNPKTKTSFTRKLKSKFLLLSDSGGGLIVWLHKKGVSTLFSVHELVLTTFIGPRPSKLEGCHWDGNYFNNKIENLRWDTHKNNHQDRIRHKTNNQGELNGSAKLTEQQVKRMRKMYATGNYLMSDLNKIFKLKGPNSARGIIRRITWKHVQ